MPDQCPKCGKLIPSHSPNALCPACLLASTDSEETVPNQKETLMLHGQFKPGEVIDNRYRIVSLLGRGGMGEVYRADDLKLKQPVALKMLPRELADNSNLLQSLYNEVRQARRVSHQHVCRVHDVGEWEGHVFLSMEFIEGEDLSVLLRRIGRLPKDKAIQLSKQLCQGIQAGHDNGVLHLDLKPANLMIDQQGELRVTDFGLARLAIHVGEDRRMGGTPPYMAPEQFLRGEVSKRSDLYAIALVIAEMFTGKRLIPGNSLEEIKALHRDGRSPILPKELVSLLGSSLDADPDKRPDSITELLSHLNEEKIGAGGTAPAKQLSALMFTDVVGSVGLQQRLGTEAYMRYIARHDELFQECLIKTSNARILNETGDGFLVSFDDPTDAVNAALRLQHRLRDTQAEGEAIRVRVGLHLGMVTEMEERNRGEKRAVGMPINLTSRIMDLADAGQILMTRAVYEDARNYVRQHPSDSEVKLEWVCHGPYEIKGNDDSVEIFEVGVIGVSPLNAPADSGKAKRTSGNRSDITVEAEVISPADMENSDVFLTYAPIDDKPLSPGEQGWISKFHRNLEMRLEQLSGDQVKILRDVGQSQDLDSILGKLSKVKTLVSVVSPPFMKADDCVRKVEGFWEAAQRSGNFKVQDRTRLLKVVKTPVAAHEVPPRLADLFSQLTNFDFYETDPETGRLLEFDDYFGERAKQRYFERVYDLAFEICEVLKAYRPGAADEKTARPFGKTIYLAETTSDLQNERDRLRRELLERGHHIVPEHGLPMSLPEFEETARSALRESALSVHLIGNRYGIIPEDAQMSMAEVQNQLAADISRETGLERLIWMPRDIKPSDERQIDLIRRLVEDPSAHLGGEVIQDRMENFKRLLLDKLAPKPEPQGEAQETSKGGAPSIYLICDQRDEEAIEPLEDWLFDQGFDVLTPHFEGCETEVSEMHRKNLQICDGVLVYFGAATKSWVDMKLMDVRQAPGYGRARPITAKMVYVAPPDDRRKARFKTHAAEVVRQEGMDCKPAVLEMLTEQLRREAS